MWGVFVKSYPVAISPQLVGFFLGPTTHRKPLLVNPCLPRPVGWAGAGVPRSPATARGAGPVPSAAGGPCQPPTRGWRPLRPSRGRAALPASPRRGAGGAACAARGEARRGEADGWRPDGQHGLRSHAPAEVRVRPGQPPAQKGARGLCRAARRGGSLDSGHTGRGSTPRAGCLVPVHYNKSMY